MPKSKERWAYVSAQLEKLGLPYERIKKVANLPPFFSSSFVGNGQVLLVVARVSRLPILSAGLECSSRA